MPESITQDILYHCSYDDTEQPARFYRTCAEQRPLLIILHAWEWGYASTVSLELEQWCQDHDWNLICPHFRGPAWEPLSCGHDAALQDILDAADYAINESHADPENVCIVAPTGGLEALLLAARCPEKWKAISLWNPIADLRSYYSQNSDKDNHIQQEIQQACGGDPTTNPAAEASAIARSPLTFLQPNLPCKITINAGIHDGHEGPVPVSHACQIFNALVLPEDHIPADLIESIADKAQVPKGSTCKNPIPGFESDKVLFQKQADDATINIFDGGHELIPDAVIQWLQDINQD